jgi:hypothetical protein
VKKVLAALGLLALFLLLFLVGATWALYLQTKGGKPAWRLGIAMGSLRWPAPLAEGVCRLLAREDLPLCTRGYMRKRLTGPLVGNPTAPCRGLSPAMTWACSEVQGLRLVEKRVSRPIVVCEAMPYPKACALYVGRAAFARGGFHLGKEQSAERICAQGRGELLAYCRVGASMEAVERAGENILRAAEEFCSPYGEELCWRGLASALLATRPKEKALEACALLSPLGAARCVAVVKGAR